MTTTSPDQPAATTVPAGSAAEAGAEPPFFAVSLAKLAVLSLCTFGLYELYWFYRNWDLVKRRERADMLPFWRAFFPFFFCYSLFARVRDYPATAGSPALPAGALAAGWILTTITWRLPDPYGLICMSAVLFLLPVQAAVNRLNAVVAPDHDRNSRFSAWNWLALVVGGLLCVMAVIGAFLPEA